MAGWEPKPGCCCIIKVMAGTKPPKAPEIMGAETEGGRELLELARLA